MLSRSEKKLLNAALRSANTDALRIFPAKPNAKTPAIAKWPERATTNSEILIRLWAMEDFNPAVACGFTKRIVINGVEVDVYLVVVDYDMKPGQLGAKALARHTLLGLADTRTIQTPNGIHKYYWSLRPIPNSQSRIAPNVDVRGVRGYVIGEGAIIEGVEYHRVGEFDEIAFMPAELEAVAAKGDPTQQNESTNNKQPIGELDRPEAIETTKLWIINHAPEAIEGSGGDRTTFQVAAHIKDLGISEEKCLDLMFDNWNEQKAVPPWAYDALRTKVRNAYAYGQNAPGAASAFNEFDVENSGDEQPTKPQQKRQPFDDEPAAPITAIKLRSAFPIDVKSIPPRDWIVPGLLLTKNVTLLVAPPGSGKSLLTLQMAIMVATGMNWGGWSPRRQCKVLVINSEDDVEEMGRRLIATAQEMGVDQKALDGRIFLADAPESIVIARVKSSTRTIVRTPLVEQLVKTIEDNDIGCVVVDPFAETFEGDENSNSEVKWAGVLWREVCRRTTTALVLVHHSRKYADDMAGEADVTRGGGSLIGIARILSTLFTMTETEARTMGVPVDQRTDYVRFDDAKANHSKRGAVRWFVKKTVTLENPRGNIPGDEVGALAPWKPDLMEGITETMLGALRDTIDAGIPNEFGKPSGSFFTATATTRNKDRWVGSAVMAELGCDENRAKAILKEWTAKGWIETFEYQDPRQRKDRTGVRCNAANWPRIGG